MTLKIRNTIQFLLIILFFAIFLCFAISTAIQMAGANFCYPENHHFLENRSFAALNYDYNSILASIFTLLIYAILTLLYMRISFEKTQSNELVYFTMFIIGVFCEGVRLLFPLMDLWHTNTSFTIFLSKIVIFGRAISVGSILFSSLFSSNEYRQYTEQNLILIILAGIFFAKIMPLNSMSTTPIGHLDWAFGSLLRIIQLVIFMVGILAMILKEFIADSKIKIPVMTLVFYFGYLQICDSYCWLNYGIGTAMCFTGTFYYLKNLHNYYMWNL